MWARVNAAHKRGPLGRANDTLYRVAGSPAGATAFHDITEGANPLPATPGWDFPPGLSYGCPATFTDPSGDATSLPQSGPQLDILHGDVALSADGTKVRAALTVSNL